jgi:hypothetical protein
VSPFDVTLRDIPDGELGPLLTKLAEVGVHEPEIKPAGGASSPSLAAAAELTLSGGDDEIDLPGEWTPVNEFPNQSYTWPEYRELYHRYQVFRGQTRAEGAVHIGLGLTRREKTWGRERIYVIAFLSAGAPQYPLAEFLEPDDYEETHELITVIRGKDGGRRMFGPGDQLPSVYEERFRTQTYPERVDYPGVWNRVVVVAPEDDYATMLNHALIQGRRRYPGLRPN